MKIKSLPVAFKAGPDDGLAEGEFIVYPSTFTRTPDAYGDIVAKGAFARGIAARKDAGVSLPGLYGHRLDDPDYFVAGATEESEDDHGWRVRGMFDMDSPKGPQTYRLVKAGRLRELSFAFDTLDEGQVQLEDGTKANELRDLEVFEFSFVPIGANRDTSVVAVKSAVDALIDGVKAGRVLSAKNEDTLRAVVETLGVTVTDLKSVLSQLEAGNQEPKAAGQAGINDEGPDRVKSEDLRVSPSALTCLRIELAQREFGNL
ncbi:HK97 family phage prohead protease [Microbacterium sp. NPDC056052]|uniref:HK97 family phage prohead protease n=1 Tax=Microbacterium sp. NPDC056052 TaxID=3345695 RepID=UPI0035DB3F02